MLRQNLPGANTAPANRVPLSLRGHLARLREHLTFRLGIAPRHLDQWQQEPVDHPEDCAIFTPGHEGISAINTMFLSRFDHRQIIRTRQEHFQFLLSRLRHVAGVAPLIPNLPPGACPMAFPLVVPNRNRVCRLLNAAGIDAFPWPFLPQDIGPRYHVANHLANVLLLLPPHQDLATSHLEATAVSLQRAMAVSGTTHTLIPRHG